jgi:uncharacterized membrane protein (UPF0127 family)
MTMMLLVASACSACRTTSTPASDGAAHPQVVLSPPGRSQVSVEVELARTPAETSRGLMYREKLAPDRGMLFLFEDEVPRTFWMKNTLVPLDIIFITAARRVLGVAENAEPLTTSPRSVPGISQYVLEVVGGFAQAHGVGPGTTVEFRHVQ